MNKQSKRLKTSRQEKLIRPQVKINQEPFPIRNTSLSCLLIVILGLIVYSNTFKVPFLFDDESNIYKNTAIKDAGYFAKAPVSEILTSPRLIGQLTFVMNHAVYGFDVAGYHIVNLVIHMGCGILLYWLVVLIFKTPQFTGYFQKSDSQAIRVQDFVALFVSLLFVSHPIQTQAVTYIVQRYASLATLFYLLSLVMYIQSRLSGSSMVRYAFYGVSFISAILAMKTKEIAFTLPVMITLCEFMFFRGAMKKRVCYLIPLILTMAIIPLSLVAAHGSSLNNAVSIDEMSKTAGAPDISRRDYLNTQFRVIVTYIRLLILPINQNLDYDYPIYRTFFTVPVYLSFLFLLSVFCGAVYLLYRSFRDVKHENQALYRLIAFGIFWFFVTLSVESSIIPIKDVIYEHRLYLPSAGFFIAVMAGMILIIGRIADRWPLGKKTVCLLMLLMVICLSVTAYARNIVWRDEVTLWEDVAGKSPNKARPHNNLGGLYLKHDRIDEAMKEMRLTLRLVPNYAEAYNNLGLAFEKLGQTNNAITHYLEAIRINSMYADAHSNLGVMLKKQGQTGDAIKHVTLALQINPHHGEANNNMGLLSEEAGRMDEALNYYKKALNNNPGYADGHNNLGNALIRSGKIDSAIEHIAMALQLNPNFAEAEFNMGNALLIKGMLNDALSHYKKAIYIKPDYAEAHNNMGSALMRQGKNEEAIAHYRKVLLIKADYGADRNLQIALKSVNKTKDGSDSR